MTCYVWLEGNGKIWVGNCIDRADAIGHIRTTAQHGPPGFIHFTEDRLRIVAGVDRDTMCEVLLKAASAFGEAVNDC